MGTLGLNIQSFSCFHENKSGDFSTVCDTSQGMMYFRNGWVLKYPIWDIFIVFTLRAGALIFIHNALFWFCLTFLKKLRFLMYMHL